jgi:prephenate dehydrogenase
MEISKSQNDPELASLKIAIVGLGLMGGSLAMALRGAAGKLIGLDRNGRTLKRALELSIVDEIAEPIEVGIRQADLVVLAIPVQGIVSLLEALPDLRPDGCMVLDLGSTKGEIGLAMEALPEQFEALGGHPMCGREHSGLDAAVVDLFQGETFILCRNARTTPAVEAAALQLVAQIGSEPLFMPASVHDQLVATSSHLPYVVASLLMGRAWAQAGQDRRLWQVSASGLRDTTRLASSNPEMMLEIMLTNRLPLLAQIEAYGQELTDMADALRRQDEPALRTMLETIARQRDAYLREKYGQDSIRLDGKVI